MTPSERLKTARQAAGFKSASAAAKAMGLTVSTYIAHENGQNPYGLTWAERYAGAFDVSAAWLLTGEGTGPGAADPIAEAMLAALPGIEDPKAFLKAYQLARSAEQDALGGRGDKEAFAAVVNQLYRMIIASRHEGTDADG